MPNITKIVQKMKRQPNGIRFQELAKVLEYNRLYNEIKNTEHHIGSLSMEMETLLQ